MYAHDSEAATPSTAPAFDPDPVALVTLFVAAIGTAYQALAYHRPASDVQSQSLYGARAKKLDRQLGELAADLLGLRSQFEGVQNFLANSSTRPPPLREIQFRYGAGALTFRDSSQMAEYARQVNGIVKRYSSILRKTLAIVASLEGETLRLPAKFANDINEARNLINAAQFNSNSIGDAIDSALKALKLIQETLTAARGWSA